MDTTPERIIDLLFRIRELEKALIECRSYHEFCLERAPKMLPCWKAEHQQEIDYINEVLNNALGS